ncbi:MAG: FeoA family protein [Candidatus Bipolaricaulaceae bacterium]
MSFNSSAIPLPKLHPGTMGTVYAVLGPGKGAHLRLLALGLRPGAVVRLVGRGPGRGAFLVEVDGTRVALGRGLAQRILVIPLHPERG